MKYTLTFLLLIVFSFSMEAQSGLAKIEYAEAETDYQAGNYSESLAHLETVKELLGSTNAKVMYLEILNRNAFTYREGERLLNRLTFIQKKIKDSETGYPSKAQLAELEELKKQTEEHIGSGKKSYPLNVEYLDNVTVLNLLTDTYLKTFETKVPLDKLTEVYSIHKKIKDSAINIDAFITAYTLLEAGKTGEALPILKSICSFGNPLACERYEELNFIYEKSSKHAAVLKKLRSEMVFVKGGSFNMGGEVPRTKKDLQPLPIHTVTVDDFYIGMYEVTKTQWLAITKNMTTDSSSDYAQRSVSRDWALEFIEELNTLTGLKYRLPTEAEWEYAARGGNMSNGYAYAGSNTIDEVANYKKNTVPETTKGSLKPNELGLYDLSGGLWEWCSDVYDADYYANSEATNPQGPEASGYGTHYVLRGGSNSSSDYECLVYNRYHAQSTVPAPVYGFRLALDAN